MNALLTIARKDLKLLFRNKAAFFWVFGLPILMALVFGAAFSGGDGPEGIPIAVVDLEQSDYSRSVVERLAATRALEVRGTSLDSARTSVRRGDLAAYVLLRPGLSEAFGFGSDSASGIEIGIDPRQRPTADMLRGLVTQALFESMRGAFAREGSGRDQIARTLARLEADTTRSAASRARAESVLRLLQSFMVTLDSAASPDTSALAAGTGSDEAGGGGPNIRLVEVAEEGRGLRNSFEITFPSGVAWALIGVCMAFAVSIVYERITGTFLRLRLAPVSGAQVLGGKALACFITCTGATAVLLAIGRLGFGIRFTNPPALAAAVLAAAFCFTGLSMLIAAIGRSPQSVGGAGWAVMIVMSMTGGGMMPLAFMPAWMQSISHFSLVKWSILGVEGAIWRGFGWSEMAMPLAVLLGAGGLALFLGTRALGRP